LFAYRLAKDLGLLVEDVLKMTEAEFVGWAAFYTMEHDAAKKANKRSR
jgi:hypothetical protein